ncbi:WNK lysine deficient protein kinase [Fistulifera solaris]|uniref:non-specific serine/threonine protein kinase n=1 Tax=Fistulifera solaris TaxID=1519565 RepID=A0A1Z5KLM1_FISSO|nr:WNK lysine deficient protein kinase [Fistulifera solaris]|eukprot:GAX26962.1 WNK lysine deficient protein kinase [Fistulifera solaris]
MESSDLGKMILSTIDLPEKSGYDCVNNTNLDVPDLKLSKEKDESVVSAVTLPASLEQALLQTSDTEVAEIEVPKQVIFLDGSANAPDDGKLGDPTASSFVQPLSHAISDSATIDVAAKDSSFANAKDDSRSALGSVVSAPARTDPVSNSTSNDLNEYISSPEIQNAIVERSPGGRYVRFREKLGSGASKDVYRAYDTQEGIEVAWNVVNLSGVPKNERNRIVNEVRLLERLHHHNIISFHGSWVNRERQEVNFVTEILSSGTLKAFISKVQVIRWKIAKRWAIQILKGLEYLHSQDPPVIHRDLKCENIFINGTSGDLRIGDLGLSTVHRNGRVLSVLGTPEFMAPDMYEDKPYDEKVDIYAFGMCVLEIFTQEIPYSECNNPAQIYKKVSSGEPPEILGRIQSKHARDFVNFCLGYRDNEGNYIRPSATDLLQHPFLAIRENDDDEVIVDPPLRETMISEAAESQSTTSNPLALESNNLHDDETDLPPRISRLATEYDDDGDEFEEMPESETNMKKVKVLMGRDTEWKEDEQMHAATVAPIQGDAVEIGVDITTLSVSRGVDDSSTQNIVPQPSEVAAPSFMESKSVDSRQETPTYNYVVATVVIEDEGQNVRPYADEILKLVVTLPIEGQTQNVQFDFDLVEDDPIQVAKEMVQELGIPQGAVLEISETISGLARAARMKQDRYAVRIGNAQNMIASHPVQHTVHPPAQQLQLPTPVPVNPNANVQHLQNASFQQQMPMNFQHQQQQPTQFLQGANVHNPAVQIPLIQNTHFPHSATVFDYSQSNVSSAQIPHPHFQAQQEFNPNVNGQHVPSQVYLTPQKAFGSNQSVPTEHQQIHVPQHHSLSSFPVASSQQAMVQAVGPSPPPYPINSMPTQQSLQTDYVSRVNNGQNGQAPIPVQVQVSGGQSSHAYSVNESVAQQMPPQCDPPVQPPTPTRTISLEQVHTTIPNSILAPQITTQVAPTIGLTASGDSIRAEDTAPSLTAKLSGDNDENCGSLLHGQVESRTTSPISETSRKDVDDAYSDEEESDDELRKLDQDFQKNLQRARKVYDSRMDSLQRCKVEREEQHLKTLEKHEKERAEFEKRLAQEAEQQRKRIEQLQLEWDRQRELARAKKKHERSNSDNSANQINPDPTHSRSVSNASSTKSSEGGNGLAALSGETGDTERLLDQGFIKE